MHSSATPYAHLQLLQHPKIHNIMRYILQHGTGISARRATDAPPPKQTVPEMRCNQSRLRRTCWRKIRTQRQAHSKPNKAGLTHEQIPERSSQFSWKLTKDKAVKYQSLELAGWYQTVPYLRLESHVRWHIATRSYLSTSWESFGSFRT
jgi:hypothetical protein